MTQDAIYGSLSGIDSRPASISSKPRLASRVQALHILEDSLADRTLALGCKDPSTVSLWKKVVGEYNDVGLSVLNEGTHEPKMALSCVQRAMQLVEAKIGFGDEHDRKKMAAITLNNMSCMYFRMGCYKLALKHAERALRIEASSKKWDNPAVTHLNMAVILSKVQLPRSLARLHLHDLISLAAETSRTRSPALPLRSLCTRGRSRWIQLPFHAAATGHNASGQQRSRHRALQPGCRVRIS
jgi:hypothetical protein